MRPWLPLSLLALGAAFPCLAQDYGRVLSSTPIVQQVSVPRQVCSQESVTPPAQKSGAGAVMGAVAGGALGNALGQGNGRALATAVGIVGGALLGDRIEGAGPAPAPQVVQRCTTQTMLENRVTAYQVVYEYAGKQYTVQMPQDPGPQVQLQITPVGGPPPAVLPPVPVTLSAPAVAPPVVVGHATTWVPAYYVYPPPAVQLQLGWTGGFHRHHHWR